MMILADAIKRAGTTDGDKVRDALADTKDFHGVTGKITIDDKRNATKSAVVLQVKDKEIKFVATVAPVESRYGRAGAGRDRDRGA